MPTLFTLVRRGLRRQELVQPAAATAMAEASHLVAPHNVTTQRSSYFSRATYASSLVMAGCNAKNGFPCVLTVSCRFGSGVARKSTSGRGRKATTVATAAMAATAAAASPLRSSARREEEGDEDDHVDAMGKKIPASTWDGEEGNYAGAARHHRGFVEGDDGGNDELKDDAETSKRVSRLTKRPRRSSASQRARRGSAVSGPRPSAEEDDDPEGIDINAEEDDEMTTPAEDPTAPMQEDDVDADDDDDELNSSSSSNSSTTLRKKKNQRGSISAFARAGTDAAEGAADVEETRVDGVQEDGDASTDDDGVTAVMDGSDDPQVTARTSATATTAAAPEQDEEIANKFIAVAFPDLAAEYAATNKVPVEEVRVDSAEVAAWCCPSCGTTWNCGVFVRCILKNTCPHCAAQHSATMASVRPDLLPLWDHTRNNPFLKPEEVEANSREVVYWTCPSCRESYTARVRDRVLDKAHCPSCALLHSPSAAALGAEESALQQEWHPLKNGDLRLDQLTPTDRKTKVWWLCGACGHEWEASLAARLSRSRRNKGKVCPACHGKGASEMF